MSPDNTINSPSRYTHMEIDLPDKLIDFINESRAPLPPVTDPDEALHIDSVALMRLVSFLELDCGFRVEDEELLADNFSTLRNLDRLLRTKRSTPPAGAQE